MDEIIEEPNVPVKKSRYNDAVRKAVKKYRQKNNEKYNASQRDYYENAKSNEEWKQKFNERCRINNQKYREKKRLEKEARPVGRPRKPIPKVNIMDLP